MTAVVPTCRNCRTNCRRVSSAGLTLIELIVALAVVSVLGMLSYRAVATATESRERVARENQRWQDIARFVRMVEIDLTQIVARPGTSDSLQSVPPAGEHGTELSFLKLDGARASVRRHGYRLSGTRIVLLRWPGTDAVLAPNEDIVLDDVRDLHFDFITAEGLRVSSWPAPSFTGQSSATLPEAIELQLEFADVGTVRRLIALR